MWWAKHEVVINTASSMPFANWHYGLQMHYQNAQYHVQMGTNVRRFLCIHYKHFIFELYIWMFCHQCAGPTGEICYDNTPCDSYISTNQPYYCGLSEAEAAGKCWQPCPGGQDSECCLGQTWWDAYIIKFQHTLSKIYILANLPIAYYAPTFYSFNTGSSCMGSVDSTVNHRFCGIDKCDADHKCTTPCPNGDECPTGESCFDNTPCSSNVVPPTYDFAYCGTSEEDAVSTCWQPCRDDNDCCYDQTCYSSTTECQAPNFQGSEHFFCGTGEY